VSLTCKAWAELEALRRAARKQMPSLVWPTPAFRRFTLYGLAAAAPAALVAMALRGWGMGEPYFVHPTVRAAVIFTLFGAGYLGIATAFGEVPAKAWIARLRKGAR
jgi:hypothetical protein